MPLALQYPDGRACGCRRVRRPWPSCAPCSGRAGWTWPQRLALLAHATRWAAQRFRCDAGPQRGHAVRRPAGRRAPRTDRAAVRGRAEHAGRVTPAPRCSCACCAMRCSAGPARPTCCCRPRRWARCCRSRRSAWFDAQGVPVHLGSRVTNLSADGTGLAGRRPALRCRGAGLQRRRGGAPVRAAGAGVGAAGRGSCATNRSSPSIFMRRALDWRGRCWHCSADAQTPAQFVFDLRGAGRCGRRVRLRRQRRARTGSITACRPRPRPRLQQAMVGVPAGHLAAARRPCCTWRRRSAPPSSARPGLQRPPAAMCARGCGPPATTWPAPTQPLWKARCVPVAMPHSRLAATHGQRADAGESSQRRAKGAASGSPMNSDCCGHDTLFQ